MIRPLSKALIVVLLAVGLTAPAAALEVGGVDLPETYTAMGTDLSLNGAGTRSKWFIDLYVGGLYLPGKMSSGQAVINASEPQAITLHIISGMITSDRMTSATLEGFESSTNGELSGIQSEVDTFIDVFSEEIVEGDVFDLVYLPGQGTRIMKNGEPRETIAGLAFKKALFGIWLSDEPAQQDLKEKMLGQR